MFQVVCFLLEGDYNGNQKAKFNRLFFCPANGEAIEGKEAFSKKDSCSYGNTGRAFNRLFERHGARTEKCHIESCRHLS